MRLGVAFGIFATFSMVAVRRGLFAWKTRQDFAFPWKTRRGFTFQIQRLRCGDTFRNFTFNTF
ncbi:MAG TPA: hypothetical protein DCP91_09815 [Eggerthellaceae bacterium]|nr:hypothetical protein [Eggerthellaceae bacterium]